MVSFGKAYNEFKSLFKRRFKKVPPKFIMKQRKSAYNYFIMAYREKTKSLGINFMGSGELFKRAALCWGEMTDEEREPFKEHAAQNAIAVVNPERERVIKKMLAIDGRYLWLKNWANMFGFFERLSYSQLADESKGYLKDKAKEQRIEASEELIIPLLYRKKRGKFS